MPKHTFHIFIATVVTICIAMLIYAISNAIKANNERKREYEHAQIKIDSLNTELLKSKQLAAKYCLEKEIAQDMAGKSKLTQIKITEYYDKIIGNIDTWDAAALDSFFAVPGRQEN